MKETKDLTKQDKKEIFKLRNQGLTMRAISEKLQIKYESVNNCIRSGDKKGMRDLSKAEAERVRERAKKMYSQGLGIKEISDALNIKYPSINNIIWSKSKNSAGWTKRVSPTCPKCGQTRTVNEVTSIIKYQGKSRILEKTVEVYFCKQCLFEFDSNGQEVPYCESWDKGVNV